jgi:hypothetical protein
MKSEIKSIKKKSNRKKGKKNSQTKSKRISKLQKSQQKLINLVGKLKIYQALTQRTMTTMMKNE